MRDSIQTNDLNLDKLLLYGRALMINGVVFALCYGGANYYASTTDRLYHFYFTWEKAIPFYPNWIYIYLSIFGWFLLPLLLLGSSSILKLSRSFLLTTFSGSIFFFIFPAVSAFDRPSNLSDYSVFYYLLYLLDKPHNLMPSLHIAYVLLFLLIFIREKVVMLWLWILWGAMMLASVLLTHQHGVLDIGGGILLGSVVFSVYYVRKPPTTV